MDLRKGREIIGLPLFSLATGKELGFIRDLTWNHDQRRITAIDLYDGGVLCKSSPISFSNIAFVGQDAVTIADEALLAGGADNGADADRNIGTVAGVLVVTDTGRNLGTLEDLVFTGNGGELLGYEISNGLVGDLLSGRDMLPPEAVMTWGKEVVVVQDLDRKGGSE